MKNMTRAALVAVLALVASLLLAPAGTATAAPSAAGAISGTVTAANPIPGGKKALVSLYRRESDGRWTWADGTYVAVGGSYTVSAPAAGSYQVRAEVGSVASATPSRTLSVSKGARLTGVNLVLQDNPTISGTITTEGFDLSSVGPKRLYIQSWGGTDGHWSKIGGITTSYAERPDLQIRPDGTYTIAVPHHYDAIRLEFAQGQCLEEDELPPDVPGGCEWGAARDVQTVYWDGTTHGAFTLADGGDIDVRSGSVVGKDVTLRLAEKLRVVRGPRITGTVEPGQVLTVDPGTYVPAATSAEYEWYSGEYWIPGATSRTFRPTTAHIGASLRVLVRPNRVGTEAPVLWTPYVTVKSRSRFAVKAKAGKAKATVTIAIKAPGVATSRIHGKASIYAKGKRIKTVNVRNGKATIKIAKQKKGKRTYTVRYSGNRVITSSTKSLKIAIR
ncbi:hypothetical protein [Aeromicrobium phoceense]|uniref:hypothetical protein n=2 Tax=Aeromicrobium TaxID=2040 RepID=UPI0028ACCFB7|nr:hypothetical protein [Aeromicrobium phoceense]